MRRRRGAMAIALTALAATGCGAGGRRTDPDRGPEGAITMVMANVGSLDPARSLSAEDTEIDWAVYTGLVTYRHAAGAAGATLIPGLATTLPRIGDGGRAYAVTLRRGLRFSDGRPVFARDFPATVEREIRLDGPLRAPLTSVIRGAAAFAAGRAHRISGIVADDGSGEIVIRLRRPDGAFDALLAAPGLGLLPANTPARVRADDPPPGVGPYKLSAVQPGRSFSLLPNGRWRPIPGIPAGELDIGVTMSDDAGADALAVVNDIVDVDDPTQTIPGSLLGTVRDRAAGRLKETDDGDPVGVVFTDAVRAPLDRRLARDAVVSALSGARLGQPGLGALQTGCDLTPPAFSALRLTTCPYRMPSGGELASALALVRRSGTVGDRVTVFSPPADAQRQWALDSAQVLRELGYVTRVQTLTDSAYAAAVSPLEPRSRPQAEVGGERVKRSSAATHGASTVVSVALAAGRAAAPGTRGATVTLSVIGQAKVPELMSARMDEASAVINQIEGLDLTSLRLR